MFKRPEGSETFPVFFNVPTKDLWDGNTTFIMGPEQGSPWPSEKIPGAVQPFFLDSPRNALLRRKQRSITL
jgi:hypothetical protein